MSPSFPPNRCLNANKDAVLRKGTEFPVGYSLLVGVSHAGIFAMGSEAFL